MNSLARPTWLYVRRSFTRLSKTIVLLLGACALMSVTATAVHAQVMIFAPHPDDEALATSGIIYQSLQAGKTVKVVVATNGDCEVPTIGQVREQETIAAMGLLGLAPSDVIFLGYPDCGLRELYYYYTTPSSQFTSAAGRNRTYAYEGLGHTDLHTSMFGTTAPYSGYSVLQDLTALLRYFKPQDLYVTSVWDDNVDHFALNYLVSEAVLPVMLADPTFQPTMHDTLVHEPCELCNPNYQWPMPTFTPTQPFPMPPLLGTTPLTWGDVESVTMTGALVSPTPATNLKSLAIGSYATQSGGGPWAQAFVKSNEIAWRSDLWANRAIRAVATASSNVTVGTSADRINDGVVVGFPRVLLTRGGRGEWVSNNELAGAWAQLTWTTPQALTRVVLHDRPDATENVTGGTLTFSDGSSLAVGALPTSGGGLTVTFAEKNVSWVRFTASAAVGTAAGLSEFEAYGPAVTKAPWQAPGLNVPPTITAGPTATPTSITDAGTSALTASGFDADGDALTYTWLASAGQIQGTGASVIFVPPTVTGPTSVRVDLWVSDGRFGIASGFVTLTVSPSGQPVNIAGLATATASSENADHGQGANKAIDGIVDGYPGNAQAEWATQAQLAGAWIQLTWASPQTISRSILHDRINSTDQIRGGLLRFSDGSTVTVGALPNDGTGLITDFPARTVTWIRFEVTSAVGGSTGLAEWQVFSAQQTGNNVNPQITAGPTANPATLSDVQTSTLSVTASDANGDPLTYSWQPAAGTIAGTGASVTFTPPRVSAPTIVRIDVQVFDGQGGAATGFVNVTVNPSSTSLNLGPFATATASSENDGRGQGAIKAIDGVVDGYPTDPTREWASVGQLGGAWIQLTWATSQSVAQVVLHDRINTADQVLSGTLRFSDGSTVPVVTLPNDGTGLTIDFPTRSATWVRFEVLTARGDNTGLAEFEVFGPPDGGQNSAPTISSGPAAAPAVISDNATSTVTVTAADADNDPLTYSWSSSGGTVTSTGASVTFTPPAVATQTVYTVTVQISDGRGGNTSGSVNITVNPSNAAPAITAGPTASPATVFTTQTSSLSVTAADANGDALTYAWTTTGGTLTGTGATRVFTPPSVATTTIVTVTVQVSDGRGGSVSGSVNISVNPNAAPAIAAGPTASPSTISTAQTSSLSVTATDANGDPLTYAWTTTGGTLTGSGATRVFTPPAVAATTSFTISVQITDGKGGVTSGSVNVTVTVNAAPTITAGPTATPATIYATQTSSLAVTASDANGDALTYTWTTTGGTLSGSGATRTFTPPAVTVTTIYTITVQVTDGNGGSVSRTVTVTVNPNSPPTVSAGPTATPATIYATQTSALSVTASDPNGNPLTYTWTTTGGSLAGSGSTQTFTPPAVTATTVFSITVVVSDGRGGSVSRSVNVTVNPNTAPTVSAGPAATPGTIYATQTSSLAVTASDANGDALTYTWTTTGGTLTGTGATRTFTPPAVTVTTTYTITVVISDGRGGSVSRTVRHRQSQYRSDRQRRTDGHAFDDLCHPDL